MTSLPRTRWLSTAVALMSLFALSPCMAQTHEFNVPAQSATTGIPEFARQAGIQILVAEKAVHGQRTAAVIGTFSVQDGLAKLIAGTRLVLGRVDSQSITLLSGLPNADPPKSAVSPDAKEASGTSGPPIAPTGATNDQHRNSLSNEAGPNQAAQLEEVVVTGSRIPQSAADGPLHVKSYTKENIERSGQTTVADFLNSLPEVSLASGESSFQTSYGTTAVQLHGLPIGTTLVLINGRRTQTSGSAASNGQAFFDLNNIPIDAIERIEVAPEGSSAIYGSDAIGGVVNIILRKDFDGLETTVKYGGASGLDEVDGSIAYGHRWNDASFSIIGSYQARGELEGSERSITGNADYTPFGGFDQRVYMCNPGTIFFPNGYSFNGQPPVQYAAVPAASTGSPSIAAFAATAGTANKCDILAYSSYIPNSHRAGLFVAATYRLSPSVELFAEGLFSHTEELNKGFPPDLFGAPFFQQFTVPASNPYNPFGQTVGLAGLLTPDRQTQPLKTDFYRPLVGARGRFGKRWEWEVAASDAYDHSNYSQENYPKFSQIQAAFDSTNPATALNPFGPAPLGPPALIASLVQTNQATFSGQTLAANGFIRGPLVHLPSGDVNVVVGGEFDRDTFKSDQISLPTAPPNTMTSYSRTSYAIYGETHIPLIGAAASPASGDRLAVSVAGRYDRYESVGSKVTPQYGVEWRPLASLLFHGTYAGAFKEASLFELNNPSQSIPSFVTDPTTGKQTQITYVTGGNSALKPETGLSRTVGIVYAGQVIPDLRLSITYWSISENNSIQALPLQALVNNAQLFPGAVVRDSNGDITQVNDRFLNFGGLEVAGFDYLIDYKRQTGIGQLTFSASATRTSHYTIALVPGAPTIVADSVAQDSGNWAPRWKGTVALGWKLGRYTANLDGRYVGRYRDYDSTTRYLGNFWLYDAHFRYALGEAFASNSHWLSKSYAELGGVNIFNSLPPFSNFYFGFVGYDPSQYDLRGRFIYAKIGVKW